MKLRAVPSGLDVAIEEKKRNENDSGLMAEISGSMQVPSSLIFFLGGGSFPERTSSFGCLFWLFDIFQNFSFQLKTATCLFKMYYLRFL